MRRRRRIVLAASLAAGRRGHRISRSRRRSTASSGRTSATRAMLRQLAGVNFVSTCRFSHRAGDDPIVFPRLRGRLPRSHVRRQRVDERIVDPLHAPGRGDDVPAAERHGGVLDADAARRRRRSSPRPGRRSTTGATRSPPPSRSRPGSRSSSGNCPCDHAAGPRDRLLELRRRRRVSPLGHTAHVSRTRARRVSACTSPSPTAGTGRARQRRSSQPHGVLGARRLPRGLSRARSLRSPSSSATRRRAGRARRSRPAGS